MAEILDVFNSDAFGMVSMTRSINKLPYQPKRLGEMGLFDSVGIRTRTAVIEEQDGVLELLPSVPVGTTPNIGKNEKRKVHAFAVPHLVQERQITAESIEGVREFGSESRLQTVAGEVNRLLERMKRNHEATEEWLRIGAIHGNIIDGNGSTVLANLFTVFGVSEVTVDFVLGTDTTKVGNKCLEVLDAVEDALGDASYDHVHALCGRDWFRAFTSHPEVKYAFQYWQESKMLRDDPRAGFEYKGIIFEQYRGKVGANAWINTAQARFFPVGVPDLFVTSYAPADFVETVGTTGLPMYAKQAVDAEFQRFVKVHTQSNPLPLCLRPKCLIKGTTS